MCRSGKQTRKIQGFFARLQSGNLRRFSASKLPAEIIDGTTMKERLRHIDGKRAGGGIAVLAALCLSSSPLSAQQTEAGVDIADVGYVGSPFSLVPEERAGAPRTDNGAVTLRLSEPLTLESFGDSVVNQRNAAQFAATALDYRLDDRLSLQGGMALSEQGGTFHALGSIHCQNGVLDAVSYRASDCTFVDDGPGQTARSVVLGAAYDLGERSRASINLFQQRASLTQPFRPGADALNGAALLNPFESGLGAGSGLLGGIDPLMAGIAAGESERTGVDVEFQVGFSTDRAGDLVLGLQLTRILDSGTEGVFYASPGVRNWTIAKPYDTARLSLDWNRGSFSGGIDSYYRSPVDFLDRNTLDSQASFDVHFSWRAPWNASLSVGASNVLGAGADDLPTADTTLADPLESIYGRIPYVRYKQDL